MSWGFKRGQFLFLWFHSHGRWLLRPLFFSFSSCSSVGSFIRLLLLKRARARARVCVRACVFFFFFFYSYLLYFLFYSILFFFFKKKQNRPATGGHVKQLGCLELLPGSAHDALHVLAEEQVSEQQLIPDQRLFAQHQRHRPERQTTV